MCMSVELQGAGTAKAGLLWGSAARDQKGGLAFPTWTLQIQHGQKRHEPGTTHMHLCTHTEFSLLLS